MSEVATAPQIWFDGDGLHIEFARLFEPGEESQSRRFARRIFAFPQVFSLALNPEAGKAVVRYHVQNAGRKAFLGALATAIGGVGKELDDTCLPHWSQQDSATLHRFGGYVSVFEISQAGPGRLQLRHAALTQDPALGRRMEDAVRTLAGVMQATATVTTGKLWVSYRPEAADIVQMIRAAEAQLALPRTVLATMDAGPAKLGLANATLGLAALGEFALPVVLPVCIGMLVVSNLGTVREAGKQVGQGKAGLPVLYTALLGCSIATGQIVAHALMEWSFRFWAQRSNAVLAEECRILLEENLPIPAYSRLVRSDEVDAQVPSAILQTGNRVRIDGQGAIPADGRVVTGSALVDETAVCGSKNPLRKVSGDTVFAGSQVLAGNIEMEVWHTGTQTQAARIARSVIEGARDLTRNPALRRKAEAMAERTVLPTLAAAGVGWAVGAGGLFTVGAVLHADYASGPKIAVPLETLRTMNLALRSGVVVRTGDALHRLAESRFLVLDDHPAWTSLGLELERLEHSLAESETDNLLRYVAGAGLYLGDGRSEALLEACLGRGLVIRQPPVISLDAGKVAVRQGEHTIILRNGEDEKSIAPLLTVEIDGTQVASLNFRHSALPRAAAAVRRLRQHGMQVFLLSSRTAQETEQLAGQLGTDLSGGDFSHAQKLHFMQGLRCRGVRAIYIGNGHPELSRAAHVSVSLGATESLADNEADIAMLGDELDTLADMVELALACNGRIHEISRKSLLPNLLCVAGGYAGVLNGITSGLLANAGVYKVYQQAARSLRDSQRKASLKRSGT